MGSELHTYRLEDCMDAIIDYRGKTPKKTDSGIPLITAKIIKNGRIQEVKEFIAEDDYDSWMRRGIPRSGDIVLTTEAPLGEVAQLDDRKIALAQRVITLRGKKGLLNNDYLKYLLQSNDIQHQLDGRGTGTTVKGIKQSELREVILSFPDLPIQKSVAFMLKTLDGKIENNRKTNQTLEKIAQALFKSWFVDFEPVIDNALAAGNAIPDELQERAELRQRVIAERATNLKLKPLPDDIQQLFPSEFEKSGFGWIPKGWAVKPLNDLLEIKYGKDHKKLNAGSIPVYGSGGVMRLADKSLYEGESVLIPRKGTLSNIIYVNKRFWTVDTMFYSVPRLSNVAKFVFYHLKTLDFTAMNVGSAVPSMTTKVLNILPLVLPTDELLKTFDGILTLQFNKKDTLDKQSKSLQRIRDLLLPKLISGEITLNKDVA
jgi:type I restriction enzyme S subunit